MPKASTNINFSSVEGDSSSDSGNLSMDAAYNDLVYGKDKTTFRPTEDAYLKTFIDNRIIDYSSLESSLGSVRVIQKRISYPITETLVFTSEDSATLSHPPIHAPTYRWIGRTGGVPLFLGSKVNLHQKTVGIMEVSYTTFGDRIVLSGASFDEYEYEVLVVLEGVSERVSFQNTNVENLDDIYLKIVVRDICTDAVIAGATVTIDGLGSGTTDANGVFTIEKPVVVGATYNVKVEATGYTSSDKDFLSNDSFIVPEASPTDTTTGTSAGLGSDIDCPYLQEALTKAREGS